MSEKEKNSSKVLAEALKALPDNKKEFLLGFGEGVTAMAEEKKGGGETTNDHPSVHTR